MSDIIRLPKKISEAFEQMKDSGLALSQMVLNVTIGNDVIAKLAVSTFKGEGERIG